MKTTRYLALLGLFVVAGVTSAYGQWAHLTMHSEPGEWVGNGQDWDIYYTPGNSEAFYSEVSGTLISGEPALLTFSLGNFGSDGTWALMMFGTDQLGVPMQPGYYPDARRAAFAPPGHPGLDVSFQHRGSNELTGEFTVQEATFDWDGSQYRIRDFRVSFEQHSEGLPPALFGQFEFHAVPEPSTLAVLSVAATLLAARRRTSAKELTLRQE